MARLSVCVAFLVLLAGVAAKKKAHQRATNNRKRECETTTCAPVHIDERDNCVLRCQSDACYEKVYSGNELEPGEIDGKRTRDFNSCVTQEGRRKGQPAPTQPAAEAAAKVGTMVGTADEPSDSSSSDDEQASEAQVEL